MASMADAEEPTSQQVVIKWHGTEFSVQLADDDTVGSLKRKIEAEAGGLPADTVPVSELLLKPGMKVMMMGCVAVPQATDHSSDWFTNLGPRVWSHAQAASRRGPNACAVQHCQLVTVAPMVQDTRGCDGSSGQDGRGGTTHTGRI